MMQQSTLSRRDFPWEGLALVARIGLAGIFLAAGLPKILDPQGFSQMIALYQILPDTLIHPAALIIPCLEVLLALLLLFRIAYPGAVFLTNGLLLGFTLTLVFNLYRGLDIACGCFSTQPGEASGDTLFYLLRDASFLLLSSYLFLDLLRNKA